MFLYGAQFFRPPNPPRAERARDLKRLAEELKFNVIKIWPMWNWCNPEEGIYVFDEVEEIFAECDKLGVKVVVNTILENAPYWLDRKYPEARYVNANGRAITLGGNSNTQSGGHPGLCLDHPRVKEAAADFLINLAKVAKPHPSMFVWDCWNEPHNEPVWCTSFWGNAGDMVFCYCPNTRKEFVKWLQDKYNDDIEALNEAWVRRFVSWDDVNPPVRHGTYADWLDWRRFMLDSMADQMEFRYRTLKEIDPDHPVMSHAGATPPMDPGTITAADCWKLAAPIDKWGTSIFPKWFTITPAQFAMRLDITRSSAGGKEIWISELQGGIGKIRGIFASPQVEPNDIRLWNWTGVAYGAKAIMYWCYRAEATSTESSGYGLVRRDGSITPRAKEAERNCQLLQKYSDIIAEYKPEPQVAILYDPDNMILNYAMEGNEEVFTSSYKGYYQAVWESDLIAEFTRPEQLSTLSHKVLITPFPMIISEKTAEGIRRFVEGGGTLIAETSFGLFDINGMQNQAVPFKLEDVFGVKEDEVLYTNPDTYPSAKDIYHSPRLTFEVPDLPYKIEFQARVFVTPLHLTTAESLARYGDMDVVAHNKFGEGEVFYFGTSLGNSIFSGDRIAKEIVKKLLRDRCKPVISGYRTRPRLLSTDKGTLLVVINDAKTAVTEDITLPASYSSAENIHTNTVVDVENNKLTVSIGAEDVTVWHLS